MAEPFVRVCILDADLEPDLSERLPEQWHELLFEPDGAGVVCLDEAPLEMSGSAPLEKLSAAERAAEAAAERAAETAAEKGFVEDLFETIEDSFAAVTETALDFVFVLQRRRQQQW